MLGAAVFVGCDDGDDGDTGPTITPAVTPTVTARVDEEPEATGETPQATVTFSDSALQTTNRTLLSVCVDGTGDVEPSTELRENVEQALDAVAADEGYRRFYPEERRVAQGCPPPTVTLGAPVDEEAVRDEAVFLRGSGVPSEHRVFIYAVASDAYAETFGERTYFLAAAELLCEGDQCANVTTAIYIPEGASVDALQEALLTVLGLVPTDPDST